MVERSFQLRFVLSFVAILLVGAALSGTLLYMVLSGRIGSGFSEDGHGLLTGIVLANGLSLLVLLYPAARMTLKTSHRIGGPLHRLRNITESIKEGNLDVDTRLREGDQLGPMALSLGEMASALKDRVVSLQQKSDVLTAAIDVATHKSDNDPYLRSSIREELLEIKRRNDEMVNELLRYRT